RLKKRQTAVRLPAILCLRIAKTTSSSVRSGCFSIRPNRKSACFSNGEMLPPRGWAAQRPVCRKHLTQITAVLALTANSSAASRREAPLSTSAITRSRISPEYAFGIAHPPKSESMPIDSPSFGPTRIPLIQSGRNMLLAANYLPRLTGRNARADSEKAVDGFDELGHGDRLRQIGLATGFPDALLVAPHRKGGHRD